MILKNYILSSKILFLVFFLVLLTSFARPTPPYCKMSDRIVSSYEKEFAKPRRLILYGSGGAMMDDIQNIELCFLSYDAINVEEARVLYVEMMEEILCRYNRHEKIRPYLHNYPFEINNIKLKIAFENSKREITGDGHMAFMFIGRNHTLYYKAYDPIKEEFYTLHEESYEEAYEKLRKLKNN